MLIRRPTMEATAQRMGFDTGAVKTCRACAENTGRLRFCSQFRLLLLFDPGDVGTVLNGTPPPFRTDTMKSAATLNFFIPASSPSPTRLGAPCCGLRVKPLFAPLIGFIHWCVPPFAKSSERILRCRNTLVHSRFTRHEEDFVARIRGLYKPGGLIAMLLVLLMMGVGGAAMAIAARGWPF
jgi:hypothetical protein